VTAPADPAVTGQEIEDALAELALLRWRLDLDNARTDLLFEQVRRQFARPGPLYDAAAETQAGNPEMTTALRLPVSHRRVTS
jgi:hypothetical protein